MSAERRYQLVQHEEEDEERDSDEETCNQSSRKAHAGDKGLLDMGDGKRKAQYEEFEQVEGADG